MTYNLVGVGSIFSPVKWRLYCLLHGDCVRIKWKKKKKRYRKGSWYIGLASHTWAIIGTDIVSVNQNINEKYHQKQRKCLYFWYIKPRKLLTCNITFLRKNSRSIALGRKIHSSRCSKQFITPKIMNNSTRTSEQAFFSLKKLFTFA